MAAKARELDLRGLEMNGDRILKAVATACHCMKKYDKFWWVEICRYVFPI